MNEGIKGNFEHSYCFPTLFHISILVETPVPEMYGLGKGDIHYVLANMPPATGVGNNGIII